jgi:hypothetical protein
MNTKKILGISICMLVMSMIPVAAGATINQNPEPTGIGYTTIQGFIFGMHDINGGQLKEFRCIFVHYVAQGLGQRSTGVRYFGQIMVIPGDGFKGLLMPGIIMGYVPGVLEF